MGIRCGISERRHPRYPFNSRPSVPEETCASGRFLWIFTTVICISAVDNRRFAMKTNRSSRFGIVFFFLVRSPFYDLVPFVADVVLLDIFHPVRDVDLTVVSRRTHNNRNNNNISAVGLDLCGGKSSKTTVGIEIGTSDTSRHASGPPDTRITMYICTAAANILVFSAEELLLFVFFFFIFRPPPTDSVRNENNNKKNINRPPFVVHVQYTGY